MAKRIAGRLPKTGQGRRTHTHIPADWLKVIDQAATLKGVTRSSYIANAAHKAAVKDVAR